MPSVSGIAAPPYNLSSSAAQVTTDARSALLGGGAITVNAANIDAADVVNASASSNVDGAAGGRFAQGSTAVANLTANVSLLGRSSVLDTTNLFSLNARTLTSSANVSGDFGSLAATGDAVIIDANGVDDGFATFTVLGRNFDVQVDAAGHVAPNTTLVIDASSDSTLGDALGADLAGSIRVILNEQSVTGDGISSRGIEVNALHVTFNNVGAEFAGALNLPIDDSNLVTGDLIVGHSEAFLQAVPEPCTVGAVVAVVGLVRVRRRRRILTTDCRR